MATEITNTIYDYSNVSADDKAKLISFEGELARSRKRVASELIKHGEVLHGAQQLLASYNGGEFGAWLEAQGLSRRSAYNAISAYVEFGACANLHNVEVSAMYELAKNEKAKKKALELVDKGIKVTHAMAKHLIEECEPKQEVAPIRSSYVDSLGLDGEEGRTELDGTEPTEETSPSEPRSGKELAGEDDGQEFEEMDYEEERVKSALNAIGGGPTSAKPEPIPDSQPDPAKAKNLANQYRDKLARAICDYHELAPNRVERDRLVKLVQGVELW